MELYFVRHGKTEFNLQRRMQGGGIDSPLLEEGIVGAKKVGQELQEHQFDVVLTSPLQRTMDTMGYIMESNNYKKNSHIIVEKDFREIEFGTWEGKNIEDMKEEKEFINLKMYPEKYDPSSFGGESYNELVNRSYQALLKYIQKYSESEKMLIVSHGVTLTSLIKKLEGKAVKDYRESGLLDNTTITILETTNREDVYRTILYNGL